MPDYNKLVRDLRDGTGLPVLRARMSAAADAIEELLHIHQLDQSEIVRLRRVVEELEGKAFESLGEANRAPYQRHGGY